MRIPARRAVLAWLALTTGACACTASPFPQAPPAAPAHSYPRTESLQREDQLAVIGDVQRTSVWGRMIFAESNLSEQSALVNDVATQQFRGLVLLGDMVFTAKADNWNYFD